MDKKGKAVGKVMITAVLNESQIVLAEAEVDIPKDFNGHVSISEIRVTGLKNKEILGKQVTGSITHYLCHKLTLILYRIHSVKYR